MSSSLGRGTFKTEGPPLYPCRFRASKSITPLFCFPDLPAACVKKNHIAIEIVSKVSRCHTLKATEYEAIIICVSETRNLYEPTLVTKHAQVMSE